ncbi:MAG: VWA domain-containing protein, partial [Eggerthellaceae bacterium]|nr:VWA domain-containing protein [Eggerthellaceae bacterium]
MSQLGAGYDLEEGLYDEYVRYRKIAGRGRRNILFMVDTSGSMVSSGRLGLVKGCVVSLLTDAYVTRTRVAIVAFGGSRATLVMPFSSSAEMAARRIDTVKGGGSTPLLEAIGVAAPLIDTVVDESIEVVLLSDGGCDRPRRGSAEKTITGFAEYCRKRNVPIRLGDAWSGTPTAKKRAKRMA